MKDRVFIDSNTLIYGAYGNTQQKQKVREIVLNVQLQPIISIQVLKEFANVCTKKKLHYSYDQLIQNILEFKKNIFIAEITPETIIQAIHIQVRYGYSFYDSLIIATALESNCKTLYTEDLQHGQKIARTLKIVNPFV